MRLSVAKKGWVWCQVFVTKIFEEKNLTLRLGVTFYFYAFTDDIHLYTHIIYMHDLFITQKYPRVMFRE